MKKINLKKANEMLNQLGYTIDICDEPINVSSDKLLNFLKQEAKYRLGEFHGFDNPSEELIDYVADNLKDKFDDFVNYDALDNIISESLEEFFANESEEVNLISHRLDNLKNNPRVSKLWFDDSILIPKRKDSIWYNGVIISFTLDNKYCVSLKASGEVKGTIIYTKNGELLDSDFKNQGILDCLNDAGINNDDDFVYDIGNNCEDAENFLTEIKNIKNTAIASIVYDLNNWFEVEIINIENDENLTEFALGTDIVCEIDDIFNLSSIDDYIKNCNK